MEANAKARRRFHSDLERLKCIHVPDHEDKTHHPFLLCMQAALKKYKVDDSKVDWNAYHALPILEVHEGGRHIRELCELLKVNCWVYRLKIYEKYSRMVIEQKYGVLQKVTIHLFFTGMNWCWLKKTKESGQIKGLRRMYCHTCFRWLPCKKMNKDGLAKKSWFKKNHTKYCVMCGCGRAYTTNGRHKDHPVNCDKISKKKTYVPKDMLACKKYEPSTFPSYKDFIHHCDFECIPSRNGSFFEVDSVGFWDDTPEVKKYQSWCGKEALKEWIHYIMENIVGQIWFFYGSKFDAFFVLEYMIQHGLPVDQESTMVRGNMVYSLGIIGKKGVIVIKDLTKFLMGSLKWNCTSFGIPIEHSKTDFDHEKVKTWEDVEKHKEERLEYLRLDVISQREVFLKFADIVWNQTKLSVSDFISIAQLSNAITTLYIPHDRLYKIPVDDEAAFRQAYYGGRLVVTRPYWESSDMIHVWLCENDSELSKLFPSIEDYYCYYDACSLYPTQMKYEKIACGKPYYIKDMTVFDSKVAIHYMNEEAKIEGDNPKALWAKRAVLVDIDCPDDILIPFLMRRDKHGNNVQTLEPIRGLWYAGVEVLEAIRVGYKVIRIYAFYHFPYYEKLFEKFVTDCYALRKQHPGTAIDLVNKMMMNSASGKGGQKGMKYTTVLHIGAQQILEARSKRTNQIERVIYDERARQKLAAVVKEEQIIESTPYSLSTTTWILAQSRVYMSKFMRKIDGYRNPHACPLYGDTDSLFLHWSVVKPLLDDPKTTCLFGKELGQFKNEIPNGKIVGMITLAPKTKIQLMILPKWKRDGKKGPHVLSHAEGRKVKDEKGRAQLLEGQYELMCQMTCKGIPHYSKPYRYHQDYTVGEEETLRMKSVFGFVQERAEVPTKEKTYAKHVRLKDRYYVVEYHATPTQEAHSKVKACITWDDAHLVQKGEATLTCIFGSMQRNLVTHCEVEKNGIALDYQKRNVSETSWWEKKRRIQVEGDLMTYPVGYRIN